MKKFQENLLIVIALGLCGLCVWQWVREAGLRHRTESLSKELYAKKELIQTLEGQLKRSEADVLRLDQLKTDLTATIKTNRHEIVSLTKLSEKLEKEIETQKAQMDVYKDAIEKANANIQTQNENIKKQNEMLKDLAAERNASVEKYNQVVTQYNDLVKQFEKFQEDVKKANEPAKK
jgi:chromosome segregation ATPase